MQRSLFNTHVRGSHCFSTWLDILCSSKMACYTCMQNNDDGVGWSSNLKKRTTRVYWVKLRVWGSECSMAPLSEKMVCRYPEILNYFRRGQKINLRVRSPLGLSPSTIGVTHIQSTLIVHLHGSSCCQQAIKKMKCMTHTSSITMHAWVHDE